MSGLAFPVRKASNAGKGVVRFVPALRVGLILAVCVLVVGLVFSAATGTSFWIQWPLWVATSLGIVSVMLSVARPRNGLGRRVPQRSLKS
jgi:hypothetical protein